MTNEFDIKITESAKLSEKMYSFVCSCGLNVYIVPKDMSTSYALFGVNFGSFELRADGKDKIFDIPLGTAHFLEHKMFECEDGDAFSKLAAYGAYANAYTSYDKTAYLFSCTSNQYESLEILLGFVSKPYFTPESIEKERGIIDQEIKMYLDNPGSRLMQNMTEAMYAKNGIKHDIVGTTDSIKQIDTEVLYRCHGMFYTPDNTALFLCGNFEPEKVRDVCEKVLTGFSGCRAKAIISPEPSGVCLDRVSQSMEVSNPLFAIGVKDTDISPDPCERMKKSIALEILCEMLFSKSSVFFTELYESGMISGDLGYWSEHNRNFSFLCLSGECRDPEQVFGAFCDYIEKVKTQGLDEESFERCKRVIYSNAVRAFDSTESIANSMMNFVFDGEDLFDFPTITEMCGYSDVCRLLDSVLVKEHYVLSSVLPKETR